MARVLVVDDDASMRAYIELALKDEGYEVLAAEHGAAALAVLEAHAPDLILLDMLMPVMDGYEFARKYQARSGPKAPIVVIAGTNAGSRAAQIGAHAFLAKPFELSQLYDCVMRFTQQ